MKEVFIYKLTLFTVLFFLVQTSNAQVTVGSDLTPEPAAILQLKQRTPANPTLDNSNSDKGLGLPRVELKSLSSLEPFLGSSTSAEILMLHQGLMIYNLTDRPQDGLKPGVYVWDGKSFWVKNDQINPFDFALDFVLDGVDYHENEILFSSGLSTVPLAVKKLTVNWKPKSGACDLIWVSEENNKILWSTTLPNTTGSGGSFDLNLDPIAFTQAELDNNSFLEKTTTLIVRILNSEGEYLSKSIKITQIHQAINIKGIKDGMYLQLDKDYKVSIASNFDWQMTTTGATEIIESSTIPASSAPNTTGTDYTFKLLSTPTNEGKEVTLTFKAANGEIADMPITLRATKEYANTYMGTPGSTVNVPIRQAYIAWKNKLDRDLSIDDSKMTAELVWQDVQSLVTSVAFVTDNKTGLDRTIAVRTTNTAGNALVAFKIDNEIVWSWHIWMSSYVPTSFPASQGVENVTGGRVFNRFNGTRNYIIMDRDLGATMGTPAGNTAVHYNANKGLFGFFYQWGRKDPFPPIHDIHQAVADLKARPLYDKNNIQLNSSGSGLAIEETPTDITYNVINAINKPMTFYKGSPTNDDDWFSAKPDIVDSEAWLEYYNEEKAIYDPCPQDWRVPYSSFGTNALLFGYDAGVGTGENFSEAGYYDQSANYYGVMPINGFVNLNSALQVIVDNNPASVLIRGTVWFADESSNFLSAALVSNVSKTYHGHALYTWGLNGRSTGYSVRCVKHK